MGLDAIQFSTKNHACKDAILGMMLCTLTVEYHSFSQDFGGQKQNSKVQVCKEAASVHHNVAHAHPVFVIVQVRPFMIDNGEKEIFLERCLFSRCAIPFSSQQFGCGLAILCSLGVH